MAALDVIRGSQIFQRLSAERLQRIASISKEETFEAGRTIFREGDEAKSLYVLEEGRVVLEMRISPLAGRPAPDTTVDVIIKGEPLGWSALVEPFILTLSARAVDKCKVIAIDAKQLRELMDADPAIGYEIMKRLSEVIASRLTHTRQTLVSERGLALLSQCYSYEM